MPPGRDGFITVVIVAGTLMLSACGGRVSHPVAATNPYDDLLTCDHLRAERTTNEARIADLKGEKGNDGQNNIGMAVASPLLLDVSNSEEKEIAAFQERDKVLDALIAKKCTTAQ